jgi:hypothetical protein
MAHTAKGLTLAAKVTALTTGTGPTAPQKVQIQKIVDLLDAKMRDGQLDYDLSRIYDAVNGLS